MNPLAPKGKNRVEFLPSSTFRPIVIGDVRNEKHPRDPIVPYLRSYLDPPNLHKRVSFLTF